MTIFQGGPKMELKNNASVFFNNTKKDQALIREDFWLKKREKEA